MNIHFSLRFQGQADPRVIMQVFDPRLKGRKFMYSTGISVAAEDWDKRKQRLKQVISRSSEYISQNKYFDSLEQIVIAFKSQNHHAATLSRARLKLFIEESLQRKNINHTKENYPEIDFFNVWSEIIITSKNLSGKQVSKNTLKSKNQTLNLVKRFAIAKKFDVTFQTLDMKFYHLFDDFMKNDGLSDNSRGKHFKEIKAVMREALDRDYKVNMAFQKKSFKVLRLESESVFLNEDELKQIYFNRKLRPRLEKLKDTFVSACFVGARHSDWHKIDEGNVAIQQGKQILKIQQQKTNETIHVPVHPVVRTILKKYNGKLPRIISNQKFNEAIKEICKSSELGTVVINGEKVEKWKLVSTHTARRSFATNAYLSRSMDVHQIMKCTGHRTEASFLKYLKLDGRDFAIQAADSKFFTADSFLRHPAAFKDIRLI